MLHVDTSKLPANNFFATNSIHRARLQHGSPDFQKFANGIEQHIASAISNVHLRMVAAGYEQDEQVFF
jgi:hypothetical protein